MTTDTKLNIYQRLNEVRKAVSHVNKDLNVGGQYKGVGHDQVTGKTRDPFIEAGVMVVTSVAGHEIANEWDTENNNGKLVHYTMTSADVVVSFVNIDNPDERVEVNMFGYGVDNQDKGPGKSISYASKYAVLKTLYLVTGEDADATHSDSIPQGERTTPRKSPAGQGRQAKNPGAPMSDAQANMLQARASEAGIPDERMKAMAKEYCKVESCNDLSKGDVDTMLTAIANEAKRMSEPAPEPTAGPAPDMGSAENDGLPF